MLQPDPPAAQHCARCGTALKGLAPEGLCAACLLETGLEPAAGPADEATEQEGSGGRRFGDYELLQEIARGGMGIVFKARQLSLGRLVAVKMIRVSHFLGAADFARFRQEARTAASLQHPNIVAIHEVGECEGQPYFSMEFVEGQSLAERTRDNPLPPELAADYLQTIARAIHYAHQHGILHRDLKPSNILIDPLDRPRITDFGLAKHLPPAGTPLEEQNTSLTLSGQVLGSPNFMPPEQVTARHDLVGPASDVYGLGAVLYHLLTGRAPFLAESVAATLRLVAEGEPVAPRLLTPAVPRDLETICLKCLEKDPRHRYASAQELAEELVRFLRDEPIHARPLGATARWWRWGRRNPTLARTGAAAVLLFLAVVVGSPIALLEINRARRQAEARQRQAQQEASKSQQVAQFLKDMLRSAGPSVARGRDATLLRELLEKTAERLDEDLRHQPEVMGDMSVTLGNTYRDMGDFAHAISMLEKAVVAYRQAFGGAHHKLALALGQLGSAQSFATDVTAGKRNARLGLEMARQCGDPETLATCLLNVARSFEGWGMTSPDGLPYAREAVELRRKPGGNPTALADCLSFVAGAMQDGDPAEAERLVREALELNSRNLEPDHPSVVSDIFMLGQIELTRGKLGDAEANLRETLRRHRKIYDQNHPHRFIVLRLLGEALTKQGKLTELETLYREAVALDGEHPNSLEAVDKLASILRGQGRAVEADALISERLSKWKNNRGTNDPAMADVFNLLANRAAEEKRFGESETFARQALDIELRVASNNLPRLINTLGGLAATLDRAGRYADSETLLQQRLDLQRRVHGSNDLQVADSLGWMAWVYAKDRKPAETEALLAERLAIQKKHFGSEHTNLFETLERLGTALEEQGKLSQAETVWRELLAGRRKLVGAEHAETLGALAKLNVSLVRQDKLAEAALNWSPLLESNPRNATAWLRRGEMFGRAGWWKESAADLSRYIQLAPADHTGYRLLAPILLFTGQVEDYRQVCRNMLAQFRDTRECGPADVTAKCCLLLPESGVDRDAVAKLAETAVSLGQHSEYLHWFQLCKALSDYRQGRFADAADWAGKALAASRELPERDAAASLVMAMARMQLQDETAARQALENAQGIITGKLPGLDSRDLGVQWIDRIMADILLREARALIEGQPARPVEPDLLGIDPL